MKKLNELTLKEHTDLKRSGMMWIIFPDATGDFREDCKAVESSNNKCEWKDGKFEPCSDKLYHDPAFSDQGKFRLNIGSGDIYLGYASFCLFCGADIRKPISPKIEINIHPVFDDVWNMLTRDKIQE